LDLFEKLKVKPNLNPDTLMAGCNPFLDDLGVLLPHKFGFEKFTTEYQRKQNFILIKYCWEGSTKKVVGEKLLLTVINALGAKKEKKRIVRNVSSIYFLQLSTGWNYQVPVVKSLRPIRSLICTYPIISVSDPGQMDEDVDP
jgi:hypothetical protein